MVVEVTVRLFGMLNAMTGVRHLELDLPESASLRDALDALEQRFGSQFTERILRTPTALHTYMRIFVNDAEVTDLEAELVTNATAPEVSMFLLPAAEGG